MTPEQQRALAIARARRRRAEETGQREERQAPVVQPSPADLPPPGARNYPTLLPAVSQGATFGFADELAGMARGGARAFSSQSGGTLIGQAVGGLPSGQQIQPDNFSPAYEQERDISRQRLAETREAMPIGSAVAEIGGAVGSALATGGLGLGGLGVSGLGRLGFGAAEGAATGALYGAGTADGDAVDRVAGAGFGGMIGMGFGAAVPAVGNAIANRTARATIPSTDELRSLGQAAYQAADDAGVIVGPQGLQRLAAGVTDDLTEFGYHPSLHPRVGTVLNELGRLSEGNVTLKGVDILRRQAQAAASSLDRSERAIGTRIVNQIDDFVENLAPSEIVMGNAQQASRALTQGRDYWSRLRKAEMVETATENAGLRAASTGTGGNVDNATRQDIRKLLTNPRTSRGLRPAEREAAERVVRGTGPQNLARLVGRLSPEGNGLMMALGIGGTMANPALGLPAMVIGAGAKRIADGATPRNVQALGEVVRSGGQTASQIAQQARSGQGSQQLIEKLLGQAQIEQRTAPALAAIAAALFNR